MLTRLTFEAANAVVAIAVTRIALATAEAMEVFIITPFVQTMPTLSQATSCTQMSGAVETCSLSDSYVGLQGNHKIQNM